jgi:hypothetical protein
MSIDIDTLDKLVEQNTALIKELQELKGKNGTDTKKKTGKKSHKKYSKKHQNIKGKPRQPKTKKIPEQPYSAIPDILKEMTLDECIARFGILWNSDKPYAINGKAIQKFYKDYNIKTYKPWYMSYGNKDIINDKQILPKNKTQIQQNIANRIKDIEARLEKQRKPSEHLTINNIEKIENALIQQLEKLEGML